MFDWKQKKIEGILAASLYEPLAPAEQRELDEALGANPALRAEYDAMRRTVNLIPREPLESPDLVPVVRAVLQKRAPQRRWSTAIAYAAAAAIMLTGSVAGMWYLAGTGPSPAHVQQAQRDSQAVTLMSQALAEADALIEKRDYPAAYETLRKALTRQPQDKMAGEAQWRAADLAYALKRYPEALDGYGKLLSSYRDTLEKSTRKSEAIQRHLLLDEASELQFASIYAYDAALRDRTNTFAALESVIASYQGKNQYEVCDLAASDLVRLAMNDVGTAADTAPAAMVTAYAAARERCTSPIAAALLDLKAGDVFRDALNDYSQAEVHYQRAASNPVLAGRAQEALEQLASLK